MPSLGLSVSVTRSTVAVPECSRLSLNTTRAGSAAKVELVPTDFHRCSDSTVWSTVECHALEWSPGLGVCGDDEEGGEAGWKRADQQWSELLQQAGEP